jgi:hypothetical protein
MTVQEKDWVLSLPKETKLDLLEKMLVEAFEFMKMLLDSPISEGGVVTEELNDVFQKYVSII